MAATLLCDNIRQYINKGKLVSVVYLDLTKAFDTIGHSVLLSKLPSFGIIDNELLWFTDYIFNRSQVIEINGTSSESECITSGVPQGSILGPLLFIIFYDDICSAVKYSDIIMYADDTVLVFADKNITVIERILNQEMKNIMYLLQTK